MPGSVYKNTPLEKLLEKHSRTRGSKFPTRNADYWGLYAHCKDFIAERYYSNVAATLALDGGRFTKHTIDHVDDVIVAAGSLLGIDESGGRNLTSKLSPFEVFVLIFAILLHDAGNVFGRSRHEEAVAKVVDELGPLLNLTDVERKLVVSVARAHGGRTDRGEKDTITDAVARDTDTISNIRVNGRRLAAIVRLADEFSENQRRADPEALRQPYTPEESALPNKFCNAVTCYIDCDVGSLNWSFAIDRADLGYLFLEKRDGVDCKTYLVDYVSARITKADQERRYCNRFLNDLKIYTRINARIGIWDGHTEVENFSIEITDGGYPAAALPIRELQPKMDGRTLAEKFAAVRPELAGS